MNCLRAQFKNWASGTFLISTSEDTNWPRGVGTTASPNSKKLRHKAPERHFVTLELPNEDMNRDQLWKCVCSSAPNTWAALLYAKQRRECVSLLSTLSAALAVFIMFLTRVHNARPAGGRRSALAKTAPAGRIKMALHELFTEIIIMLHRAIPSALDARARWLFSQLSLFRFGGIFIHPGDLSAPLNCDISLPT